jgi:hypothetical protein
MEKTARWNFLKLWQIIYLDITIQWCKFKDWKICGLPRSTPLKKYRLALLSMVLSCFTLQILWVFCSYCCCNFPNFYTKYLHITWTEHYTQHVVFTKFNNSRIWNVSYDMFLSLIPGSGQSSLIKSSIRFTLILWINVTNADITNQVCRKL